MCMYVPTRPIQITAQSVVIIRKRYLFSKDEKLTISFQGEEGRRHHCHSNYKIYSTMSSEVIFLVTLTFRPRSHWLPLHGTDFSLFSWFDCLSACTSLGHGFAPIQNAVVAPQLLTLWLHLFHLTLSAVVFFQS